MFGYSDLPISEERLAEMREPLSGEARMVLELTLAMSDVEEDEQQAAIKEIAQRMDALSEDDRRQLLYINSELGKAYGRRMKESEGFISLAERSMADIGKAREFGPSVNTMGEAVKVLREHGIEPQVSDEELKVEVKIPEDPKWIEVPSSEMDTDENGIPTAKAAPDGFGIPGDEGEEVVKLDRKEAEAMRTIAEQHPYREFLEDHAADAEELRQELEETMSGIFSGEEVRQKADDAVTTILRNSYLQALASIIKAEPEIQGLIDQHKGKDSAAARRYQERTLKAVIGDVVDEYIQEAVANGEMIKEVGEDGREILRFNEDHPKYQCKLQELEEKKEILNPEKRNIFEALQDERRGEHRMNEFAAMDTVERLTDEEVLALQSRLRRVRRGLELLEVL